MKSRVAVGLTLAAALALRGLGQETAPPPPGIGKVEIVKSSELKRGMKGYAWTVFQGTEPEAIPVEIIGLMHNALGPRQDLILAKLGGKAERTNVAGGMSGSPVYIDGKLAGAISQRASVFSPDTICGITPIESMLEISEFDESRPQDTRAPDRVASRDYFPAPGELAAQAGVMTPIETPLIFSGFHESVLREFGPLFQQLGVAVAQGGTGGALRDSKPAPGWENALHPGDTVTAVLVSGDMTVSAQGTTTYNDGRLVLAFGHSLFNLGRVELPMSKGEVVWVLASSYQPNKFANATEIVGVLKQDRHGGALGVLGETAETIPVSVTVRSVGEDNSVRREKTYNYNVFVQQRLTPALMAATLFNTISGVNDAGEENTFRLNGKIELDGRQSLSLSTMLAPSDAAATASTQVAAWMGDRFSRLFANAVTPPRLKRVEISLDLLPQRRIATIENAWIATTELEAGQEVTGKAFLRPYRGPQLEREFKVTVPAGLPKGEHRILLSDADTLNRMQIAAGRSNRFIDLNQAISLINQERPNNQLYVSLLSSGSTVYYDDKTLPSLPASVLNVMQSARSAIRPFVASRETATEQAAIPFDYVVSGSYSLAITVK
jgi:hypothetical protein